MAIEKMDAAKLRADVEKASGRWEASVTTVSELSESDKLLRLGYTPGPGEPSLEERVATARASYAALGAAVRAVGAPIAYDLRNVGGKNFITPVRDQGGCGSCVAFGTVATVEGTLRVLRNDPDIQVDLSEAHLFYCLARAQGRRCSGSSGGWWVPPALDSFKNPGVTDDACYPYVAGDQNCTNLCADWQSRVTNITGWHVINSALDMKTWLSTKGPLAACFTVYNDFFSYRSGIYHHVSGDVAGGHCICVVGYDDNQKFWICKNSWGPGWGESGFFRIAYGDSGIDASMWAVEGVIRPPSPGGRLPLFRYWNPSIGDHFYTTRWTELGSGKYGWGYEGIQCYVSGQQQAGSIALYRYWNPSIGDHFYTTNWSELGYGKYGWGYEGIQCYVAGQQQAGTVPLYRYWNPGIGDHFYTTNWGELGYGKYGWGYEGIQCYVYSQATAAAPHESATSMGTPEPVPSTFAVASQGEGAVPPTFAASAAETTVPATFAATGAEPAGPAGSFTTATELAQSFQTKERKRAGRVTIIVDSE